MTGLEAAEEAPKAKTVAIAGRAITVYAPRQGQQEALLRIRQSLLRGEEGDIPGFYAKQLDRLGTLLDSLIAEDDRETVDRLFLEGKVDTVQLLQSILTAHNEDAGKPEAEKSNSKASKTRVRRA